MAVVFIASSLEGRQYAEIVARTIEAHGARPLLWWSQSAFPIGATLIESLFKIIEEADSAIIIMTADDETIRRGARSYSPAQNVLLEYGLFAGRLGRDRVAVVTSGNPRMPSDLDGVLHLRLPDISDATDIDLYITIEIRPRIVPWLHELDAGSSDGLKVAKLIDRLVPGAKPEHRQRIKARVICEQVDPDAFPRLTPDHLEHLLLRYTDRPVGHKKVGYTRITNVNSYLDLSGLIPGSEDEQALAGHLARHVADLIANRSIRPTALAISKLASQGILRSAAARLPVPLVMVSPYGPNIDTPIEGYYESGDRAILLHDVALSGQHLVDCIVTMRSHGLVADDLVTLVQHHSADGQFHALMRENRISVHCATLLFPDRGRVLCGAPSVDGSNAVLPCVLCDVLQGKDDVPMREIFSRTELPSEVLIETDSFAVIADVAPLTPGHILIVSKRHLISMAKCRPQELAGLDELRKSVGEKLQASYGKTVAAFEHGLCNRSKMSSCGIDHAHLHMLPMDRSLVPIMRHDFNPFTISSLAELADRTDSRDEYLFLIGEDNLLYLALTETPTRQYFRRVVSAITGRDMWNWNDEVILKDKSESREWIKQVRDVLAST